MIMGNRIKQRRLELKMSADSLAQMIGKDRSTVYRYESGNIDKISSDILIALAQALNTTPSYLMGLEQTDESMLADFLTSEGMQIRHMAAWYRELGHIEFTDAENQEIISFAKYLVFRRKD